MWERVTAVTGPGGPGSGYEVAPRLLLTSAHVSAEVGAPVSVFHPGRPGVFAGTVVWCGASGGADDAALVAVEDDAWEPQPGQVGWGRSVTHRPGIACESWGVPNLVQRSGRPIDVVQATGTLNPGDRIVGNRYVARLDGFPPEGDSPWGGMSGAALLSDGLVLGVIATEPAGRGHAALEAVPVSVLLRNPSFTAVVAAHAGSALIKCDAVELRPLADAQAKAPNERAVPSPAGLLPARRAVVPFRGRAELLAELTTWANDPGLGVWLLHARGGQGKTRLAHHFGGQLVQQGRAVLWLDPRATAADLAVLAEVRVPLLVVVDYAEGRTAQLADVADLLAQQAGSAPVKLLLLARTAGAWWTDTLPTAGVAARDLATTARVAALDVLDDTNQDRGDSYRAAVNAFAAALTRVPGHDDEPWAAAAARLTERAAPEVGGQTVLAVQMTALADLLDSTTAAGSSAGDSPEDRLLQHEYSYWGANVGDLGLSLAAQKDVVAATALLGPTTAQELESVVARVPAVADLRRDRQDAVRAWLLHLYPGTQPHTFAGLAPDRLAERLVGRLLEDTTRTSVVEVIGAELEEAEAETLLTVATRAVAHPVVHPRAGEILVSLCVRHLSLLVAAVRVAVRVERPAPLLRALEQAAASAETRIDTLYRIQAALPERTHVLADTAADVAAAIVGRDRQALIDHPSRRRPALAASLIHLAGRLGDLGRYEDGLTAIGEAVEILRRYAKRWRLDAFIHLAELATSLNLRSVLLGELGRHEESLAAIEEAVKILRWLGKQRPDAYLRDLAASLTVLAYRLGDLGQQEGGLTAIGEAVEILRRLAWQRPDIYLPYLVSSLNIRGNLLGELGRYEEGLAAIEEAVDANRRLAEQGPDAYLLDLTTSLLNYGLRLGDLGRYGEGLAPIEEAVEILRRLTKERPDAYLAAFATGLNNRAKLLEDLGRYEEGLPPIEEAVEILRRLAKQRPDAYLLYFATSLYRRAKLLGELGRHEEGLAAIEEAVGPYRRLAKQRLGTFLPTRILSNYGLRLADVGRHEEGLAAIEEAVEIQRRLAKQRPHDYLRDLATSLNDRAKLLGDLGRHEEGLAAIEEAVDIQRRLAKQGPHIHLPELASSLYRRAKLLGDLSRYEDGLTAIGEAVDIQRRVAQQRSGAHGKALEVSLSVLDWLQERRSGSP
ncbi:tetratricopeptide repeat protein [Amycolatopsis sp. NPDC051371]|uniref:tetratricopeptide repeat protein n=1 Tax=Amycolatopsis sp. NPDC051371 TaxID=3155800 RepID=UPI0034225EC1